MHLPVPEVAVEREFVGPLPGEVSCGACFGIGVLAASSWSGFVQKRTFFDDQNVVSFLCEPLGHRRAAPAGTDNYDIPGKVLRMIDFPFIPFILIDRQQVCLPL